MKNTHFGIMYLKQFGGNMKEIANNELENIQGGAISPWTAVGLGALFVFLVGVYDGLTRPLACNE